VAASRELPSAHVPHALPVSRNVVPVLRELPGSLLSKPPGIENLSPHPGSTVDAAGQLRWVETAVMFVTQR
jgi:hypothetical protein